MYPWISRTLDFGLQFSEKKCGLYIDVYGIRYWLIESRQLLNDDKTEFLVIGTCQQLNKLSPSVLHVGVHTVGVRNFGLIFDNLLSVDSHINQVCKTTFYHIHNICRISKYLSQESLKTLVHAFVTSRLDYCCYCGEETTTRKLNSTFNLHLLVSLHSIIVYIGVQSPNTFPPVK